MKTKYLLWKRATRTALLILLLCMAGLTKGYAYDFSKVCSTGQTLYYNITDATNHYVEITYPGTSSSQPYYNYTRPTGNISLPSTVTYGSVTYTVKAIGDYAFYDCSYLTGTLSIPSTVTRIGYAAFFNCERFTGTLSFPYNVTTISGEAFRACHGFTGSLDLSHVTYLGNKAFRFCDGFNGSLTLSNNLTVINDEAFYHCTGFTGELSIPDNAIYIGNSAFDGCSGFTDGLYIKDNVTYIGNRAFAGCSGLTGFLHISSAVTRINNEAFYGCSGFYGRLTIGDSVTSIGDEAFDGCSGFGQLTLGNHVASIGSYAFDGCGFHYQLTIPSSVTSIGQGAFKNCSGFTGPLTIPNSVTQIGSRAFYGCSGFSGRLTIGDHVTSIDEYTFTYCSGFTSVKTLATTPPSLGNLCFAATNISTMPVIIPCGTLSAYQANGSGWRNYNLMEDCGDLDLLTYSINPDGVSVSVTGHIDGVYATGSITIPNTKTINGVTYSVTAISDSAFYDYFRLTGSLHIPDSVRTVGNYAFYNCSGFSSLTLGDHVETIGNYAFYQGYNGHFTGDLTIPNSVTYIGDYAFHLALADNKYNGTLTIGTGVTHIGAHAFFNQGYGHSFTEVIYNAINCADVTANDIPFQYSTGNLTIGDMVQRIPAYMFYQGEDHFDYTFNGTLTIGKNVTSIGQGAFKKLNHLTQVNYNAINCADVSASTKPFEGCRGTLTIGDDVERIPARMFYNCTGFTSLTIGRRVTSIGDEAFKNCSGLTQVNYNAICANGAYELGFYPFYGCTGTLTIGDGVTKLCWGLFAWANFTGDLTIPASVRTIDVYAFRYCTGFTSLTFHQPGNDLKTIGHGAFQDCSGFTGSLTIPDLVETIDSRAFQDCSGFTGSLIIPHHVQTIGYSAFEDCSGFSSLTIGGAVTSIGQEAFNNCTGLSTMMVYPQEPPTLGSNVFENVNSNIQVYVPCATFADYQAAPVWSDFQFMECDANLDVVIIPKNSGTWQGGRQEVIGGQNYFIAALPYPGYTFMNWSVDGEVVSCNANYEFMVNEDVTLEAVFMPMDSAGTVIGEGESTHAFLPSASNKLYSLSEQIYTPSEIGESTTISTLSFYNAGAETTRNYVIYMMHTSKTSFSSNTNWITMSAIQLLMQKVYSGPVTLREGMWTTIELSTPFNYNGTSNLALIISDVTGTASESDMSCRVYNAQSYQAIYATSNSSSIIPNSSGLSSLSGTRLTKKNQILINRPVYNIDLNATRTGGTVTGGGQYGAGDLCRLKAIPDEGYSFIGWMDGNIVLSTDEDYYFIVTEDRELQAEFVPDEGNTCSLTFKLYDADGDGWGGSKLGAFIFGLDRSLSFTVPEGQSSATYTVPVEEGDYIELYWMGASSTSNFFELSYANGNLITLGYMPNVNYHYEFHVDCAEQPSSYLYLGDHSENTDVYLPSYSYYNFTLSEQIYTADEIGTEGIINGIAFHNTEAQETRSLDIYLKTTDKTSFASQTDWIIATQADKVFHGVVSMLSEQWIYIPFDTPFHYDGSSNLALIIDDNTGTWTSSPHMSCNVYYADALQTLRVYGDGTNYNPASPSNYTGTLTNKKNQLLFDFTRPSTQTIALSAGTNWVSTYLNITLDDLKAALVEAMPGATNIRISSQNSTTTWNGSTWRGNIPWDVTNMYMIQAPTACEITLEGMRTYLDIFNLPTIINPGANWIAFPLNMIMSPFDAFFTIAENGDKITSQTSSSSYNGSTWRGGVSILEPGKGYIYQSTSSETKTFFFPEE